MLSDALSRSLFPFLPQLSGLHNLSTIQALNSGATLTSPPPSNQANGAPKYRCHLCGEEYDNATEFDQHGKSHFEHRCSYCDYTSKTEGRLKRHVKDFHETPPSSEATPTNSFPSSMGPGSQHSESDDSSSQQNASSTGGGGQGGACGGANPGQQKPRISKCKACGFVAETKTEFWEHSKMHIKHGKMLECPQCPFVTEYKHHLEYHLRNHYGSKPFKCAKCNYSCVNKSMLNSHMKSHSNVYQYRCEDCNYATKYCHSLKLHLRKYGHKPSVVLNPDGTPNPYPIIDVYGTRRGPRPKKNAPGGSPSHGNMSSNSALPDAIAGQPFPLLQTPLTDVASLLRTSNDWIHFPFAWTPTALDGVDRTTLTNGILPDLGLLTTQIPGQTLLSAESDADPENNSAQIQAENLESNIELSDIACSITELSTEDKPATERSSAISTESMDLQMSPAPPAAAMPTPEQSENDIEHIEHHGRSVKSEPLDWNLEETPLDLSRSAPHSPVLTPSLNISTSISDHVPQSPPSGDAQSPMPDHAPPSLPSIETVSLLPLSNSCIQDNPLQSPPSSLPTPIVPPVTNPRPSLQSSSSRRKGRACKLDTFQCDFCDMLFKDSDMFTIHMKYHEFENPFKCKECGLQTTNRLDFFVHLARIPHKWTEPNAFSCLAMCPSGT